MWGPPLALSFFPQASRPLRVSSCGQDLGWLLWFPVRKLPQAGLELVGFYLAPWGWVRTRPDTTCLLPPS